MTLLLVHPVFVPKRGWSAYLRAIVVVSNGPEIRGCSAGASKGNQILCLAVDFSRSFPFIFKIQMN